MGFPYPMPHWSYSSNISGCPEIPDKCPNICSHHNPTDSGDQQQDLRWGGVGGWVRVDLRRRFYPQRMVGH